MTVTVYVDELIFINMFVTFFLLLSCCIFQNRQIRPFRILLACFVGGIYSLIILAPPIPIFISVVLRVAVCTVILLISDSFISFRSFLKRACVFLFMNFLFAGFMLLINIILPAKNVIYSAGAVYYDIGLTFIIVLSIASYIVVVILSKLTSTKLQSSCCAEAEIFLGDKSVRGRAILDTGNSLSDSFTGKPVILAERNFISSLLDDEMLLFTGGVSPDKLNMSEDQRIRIRCFPYSGIGGTGLLPSFRCDNITLFVNGRDIRLKSAYVAVCNEGLSADEYDIILPNSLSQYFLRSPSNEKTDNNNQSKNPESASSDIFVRHILHKRSADTAAAAEKTGGDRSAGTSFGRR